MFALRAKEEGQGRAAGGRVLPRVLRRPARFASRVVEGGWTPPRFYATAMTGTLVLGFLTYGAVAGGHMPEVLKAVTARSGFAVDEVKIAGHKETSEIDVLDKVGLDGWTSLVGFDAEAARARIATLPWIEKATVRKVYPDTIEIKVEERKPFAIWQHGSDLSLVESDGRVIVPFAGDRFADLPLVIGIGAAEKAPAMVAMVKAVPELATRAKAYIRVANRRWDIRLDNGVTIRLPERGEDQALATVAKLDREQGLLSRDIEAVDARFGDRLVVKLTADAALRREASLKDAAKTRSKEKKI